MISAEPYDPTTTAQKRCSLTCVRACFPLLVPLVAALRPLGALGQIPQPIGVLHELLIDPLQVGDQRNVLREVFLDLPRGPAGIVGIVDLAFRIIESVYSWNHLTQSKDYSRFCSKTGIWGSRIT